MQLQHQRGRDVWATLQETFARVSTNFLLISNYIVSKGTSTSYYSAIVIKCRFFFLFGICWQGLNSGSINILQLRRAGIEDSPLGWGCLQKQLHVYCPLLLYTTPMNSLAWLGWTTWLGAPSLCVRFPRRDTTVSNCFLQQPPLLVDGFTHKFSTDIRTYYLYNSQAKVGSGTASSSSTMRLLFLFLIPDTQCLYILFPISTVCLSYYQVS